MVVSIAQTGLCGVEVIRSVSFLLPRLLLALHAVVCLPGCGAVFIGAIVAVVSLSDGSSGGSNAPPIVSDIAIVGNGKTSPLTITFVLTDLEEDPVTVDLSCRLSARPGVGGQKVIRAPMRRVLPPSTVGW